MLAVPAGICVAALSISVFFLVQITGRMNLSANQNLLTSSKVISEGLHNKISLDRELLFTLAGECSWRDFAGICKINGFFPLYLCKHGWRRNKQ